MPLIKVLEPFKYAHHGYRVEEFEPSDKPVDTSEECADLAVGEGWAELAGEQAQADAPAPDAPSGAPEQRVTATKRQTKAAAAA